MTYNENGSTSRVPIEHSMAELELQEPFSLQKYVLGQAEKLQYYWPDLTADMTQQTLQGADIKNGTYILRPSGAMDEQKRKFLTLSVKMSFPNEQVSVWHFPVLVDVEKNEKGETTQVFFSLTHNHSNITSLDKLLGYYGGRPLRGASLPGVCYIKQGLLYQQERKRSAVHNPGTSQYVDHILSEPLPSPPVPSPRGTLTRNAKLDDSAASPADVIVNPSPGTPKPRPRHLNQSTPEVPPRPTDSNGDGRQPRTLPRTPGESPLTCKCGIPTNVTRLPFNWSVHKSLLPDTRDMLYFMNPKGQTTWAPPPYIDKECKKREYLEYGKLNVKIFDLYRDHLKYAENSELTNYRKYQTYTSKSSYSGRS